MLRIILVGLIFSNIYIEADNRLGAIVNNAEENITIINRGGRIKKDIKNHRRYRNYRNSNSNCRGYRPIDRDYIGHYQRGRYIREYYPSDNRRFYIHNGFFFDSDDIRGDRYIRDRNYIRNRVIDRGRIIYHRFSNRKR